MAAVTASHDGEHIRLRIEAPLRIRVAVRDDLSRFLVSLADVDEPGWAVAAASWSSVAAVLAHHGLSVSWDDESRPPATTTTADPDQALARMKPSSQAVPEEVPVMTQAKATARPEVPQFRLSIAGEGLSVEQSVDLRTALNVVAMLFGSAPTEAPRTVAQTPERGS